MRAPCAFREYYLRLRRSHTQRHSHPGVCTAASGSLSTYRRRQCPGLCNSIYIVPLCVTVHNVHGVQAAQSSRLEYVGIPLITMFCSTRILRMYFCSIARHQRML